MNILNIITPCSRPENLQKISQSINIPKENYRWIVVFDANEYPNKELIPNNCETYLYKNINSRVGHAQRNYAIGLIETGHIYMNDDDTTIHQQLWGNIKHLDHDFISFSQELVDGSFRLSGENVNVGYIDSHNFIVSRRLIGVDRWDIDKYDADGYFAYKMFNKTFNNDGFTRIFIPKVLSRYNALR